MKQNKKEILLSSFIISHVSYCALIWMFCSKKSTKKINANHERSLRIILNDYDSPYSLSLEEARQITFHQRCINSLMIEVYTLLCLIVEVGRGSNYKFWKKHSSSLSMRKWPKNTSLPILKILVKILDNFRPGAFYSTTPTIKHKRVNT